MKRKISLFLAVVLLCLVITGCKSKKEFISQEDPTTDYADRQQIVPQGFNVNGSGELVCSADAVGPEGSIVDVYYGVLYKNGNIIRLNTHNKITSLDKNVLDTYYNSYLSIANNYKDLKYYETTLSRDDASVTYDTSIKYSKIDVDRLLEIEGSEDNIIIGGKANLEKWLHFADKFGIVCEEV